MIIFLHGQDTFLSRQKLHELKEKFVREVEGASLNMHEIHPESAKSETLKSIMTSAPFLARKRMIIIFEPSKISSKNSTDALLETIHIDAENENILIFWEGAISPKEKKHAVLQKLFKTRYVYEFKPLVGMKLSDWYKKAFAEHSTDIESKALEKFMMNVGNDLWRASHEIKKLSSYAQGGKITESDISELITEKGDENIFAFTDALGQKNSSLALKLLKNQYEAGMNELELLQKILWHIRNLLMAKSFSESQADKIHSWEVAEVFSLHPYVAKKVLAQSKNFTLQELSALYSACTEIDYKIKTSQAKNYVLLDLFVAKIGS